MNKSGLKYTEYGRVTGHSYFREENLSGGNMYIGS
jgi:hypothetical protein